MIKNPVRFETVSESYEPVGVIGEGGAGRVFEVKDSDGQLFALKCLHPHLATSARRKRFKNEINFCQKSEHPNLIRVLDSGLVAWNGQQTLFYVMPRYAGTLREQMAKGIPRDAVLKAYGQILDGVDAAHKLGVTHRDLKPENVLYDAQRKLFVVADFGIAHFEEEFLATAVETRATDKLLNVGYAAPEQRRRGGEVDHRADIYTLGLILNEMFTGTVPEGAGHPTIANIATEFGYLDGLVEVMRQNQPASRLQSIDEVKKQLIGRGNEFMQLQELDKKRCQVVPTSAPGQVDEVKIVDVDWQNEQLTITLNRAPEPEWAPLFRSTMGALGFSMNLHPDAYAFRGNTIGIEVEERYVQTAIDQVNRALPGATEKYQVEVNRAAAVREREARGRIERDVKAAEARARVLKSLKF